MFSSGQNGMDAMSLQPFMGSDNKYGTEFHRCDLAYRFSNGAVDADMRRQIIGAMPPRPGPSPSRHSATTKSGIDTPGPWPWRNPLEDEAQGSQGTSRACGCRQVNFRPPIHPDNSVFRRVRKIVNILGEPLGIHGASVRKSVCCAGIALLPF